MRENFETTMNRIAHLKHRLETAAEQACGNPFFGLPAWADEEYRSRSREVPVVCCGTGYWASAFLHYARQLGDLEILAVVDDAHAGNHIMGYPCLDTRGLVELVQDRPEVVCVNTGQSDAGYSHFEVLASEKGLKMLNYLQMVRVLRLETNIQLADWLPLITARLGDYLALEKYWVDALSVETFYAFLLSHIEADREYLLALNRPADAAYFRSGVFGVGSEEVYVDCGAGSGDHVRGFIRAAKGRFQKIYAFESEADPFERMEKWLNRQSFYDFSQRIHLRREVVGRCSGTLELNPRRGVGECIPSAVPDLDGLEEPGGAQSEPVVCLDDAIEEEVSFLRLDLAGQSLDILHGARRHLDNERPKVAACTSHRPSDLIDLPRYLQSLDRGYRFGLRHHSNTRYDSVFYAFAD